MKPAPASTPELGDASVRKATGKSLPEWFRLIDSQRLAEKGRRELTSHLVSAGLDEWWAVTVAVEHEKASGAVEKDGRPKAYSLCATKTIAAPVSKVFGAWSDASLLDRWLGPGTKLDFRDGGRLENRDGNRATLLRIRKDKDLRLAWESEGLAPGSAVEVLFADKGKGKTGVTLNHTRIQERRDADVLRASWGAALDALKAAVEGA